LVVLGRRDRVIVTGGENVDPAEVESVLGRVDRIGDVAVFGLPDRTWGEVVAAVFTGPADPAEVERLAAAALPASHRPRRLLRVERIARNEMGKTDLEVLRALLA
jgi:acyl-CoA synthetase (AMP-forming)/AMP-acid ligase II